MNITARSLVPAPVLDKQLIFSSERLFVPSQLFGGVGFVILEALADSKRLLFTIFKKMICMVCALDDAFHYLRFPSAGVFSFVQKPLCSEKEEYVRACRT